MWERLTHAEAARVLGFSINAVAIRLHKARKRLLAELNEGEARTANPSLGFETRN